MSIEGQGHFFTIYFPGFVCFVLYLDKISGERLQDHWSSGYRYMCMKFQLHHPYGINLILFESDVDKIHTNHRGLTTQEAIL